MFVDTGLGFVLWFCAAVTFPATVFLLCVAVAIPETVFLLCWCGPCRSCSRKFSGQEVVSDGFSNAEKGFGGSGERSSRESLVRSRLVEGRSGRANSARGQMCGRGGAAGGATVTSQRGCVGSTGKPLPQGMEDCLRALRRQAERKTGKTRKTGGPKVWRQKRRSFGPGLSGEWKCTSRMRSRVAKRY